MYLNLNDTGGCYEISERMCHTGVVYVGKEWRKEIVVKKKIITCASVSFVIILVLLSVNFLQSETDSISKENIEKENEFKKVLMW